MSSYTLETLSRKIETPRLSYLAKYEKCKWLSLSNSAYKEICNIENILNYFFLEETRLTLAAPRSSSTRTSSTRRTLATTWVASTFATGTWSFSTISPTKLSRSWTPTRRRQTWRPWKRNTDWRHPAKKLSRNKFYIRIFYSNFFWCLYNWTLSFEMRCFFSTTVLDKVDPFGLCISVNYFV